MPALGGVAERDHRFELAAAFVKDALHGRSFEHRTDGRSLRLYSLFHSTPYKLAYLCVLAINLALALWEPPANPSGVYDFYPFLVIEMLCLAVYVADSRLEMEVLGSKAFFGNEWVKAKLFAMSVILADIIIAFSLGPSVTYYVRFSRTVRPVMVVAKFRNIRKQVSSIVVSASRLGKIGLLITAHIVFFGFMAFIMFGDTLHLTPEEVHRCNHAVNISPFASWVCKDYFGYLGESILNLFVLLTTVNFPDVMLPYIADTLWSAVFFVVFLFIGLFFLMNVVLAVIYDNYKSLTGSKVRKKLRRRKEALHAAFLTLTEEDLTGDGVDFAAWERLFFTLRPDLRDLSVKNSLYISQLVFDAIDEDGSGTISLNEFYMLAEFVQLDVWKKPAPLSRSVQRRWRIVVTACELLATSTTVQFCFDMAIFFSGLSILFVDDVTDIAGDSYPIQVVETITVVVFSTELLIRLVGFGWKSFWSDVWNKVDVLLLTALIVGDIMASVLGDDMDQYTMVVVVIRLLRVSRVSHVLKRHSLLLYTLAQIVPTMMRFLAILAACFYVFGIIGMECFAGKLTEERTAGTAYAESDYLALNFDTLPTAMVTLFCLLVVNQWPVFMEACTVATSRYARAYFITFYVFAVVIILNVLVAFMLETFLSLYVDNEQIAGGANPLWRSLLEAASQRKAINSVCYTECSFRKPHHVNDVLVLSLREGFETGMDGEAAVNMNRVHSDAGSVTASPAFGSRFGSTDSPVRLNTLEPVLGSPSRYSTLLSEGSGRSSSFS